MITFIGLVVSALVALFLASLLTLCAICAHIERGANVLEAILAQMRDRP